MVGAALAFQLFGFDPNGLAAVASAIAALAALGSATESRNTARDAVRALSYATKPNLSLEVKHQPVLDGGQPVSVALVNHADHPVSRASLRWVLRNGERGEKTFGRLEGRRYYRASDGVAAIPKSYGSILLGDAVEGDGVDRVEVTYWGDYGPVGWRRAVEVKVNGSGFQTERSDLGETEVEG